MNLVTQRNERQLVTFSLTVAENDGTSFLFYESLQGPDIPSRATLWRVLLTAFTVHRNDVIDYASVQQCLNTLCVDEASWIDSFHTYRTKDYSPLTFSKSREGWVAGLFVDTELLVGWGANPLLALHDAVRRLPDQPVHWPVGTA